jgi:DNA-directed RNA polymerase subunit RPC12/RpoP
MIRVLHKSLKGKWNFLITVHPGVVEEPYKKLAEELKAPLDSESPMIELLINCDALVHGGSIASLGAHFLDIPAFQFGDVNAKGSSGWWGMPDSDISKVSPYCKTPNALIRHLKKCPLHTNANKETLASLEAGRYGKMDGLATKRAAALINKVPGKFTYCWPESVTNYSQPGVFRKLDDFGISRFCGVCKHPFILFKDRMEKGGEIVCPWCATRIFVKNIK